MVVDVDDGIDMVVDVALVGVVNDDPRELLDDDFPGVEAPDIPNIFGSSPSIFGSIPPSNSLGSIMASILGSVSILGSNPRSFGSIPASCLGSIPILFRIISFIEDACDCDDGVDEEGFESSPSIFGSIPMDLRTLGLMEARVLASSPILASSLASITDGAAAVAADVFGCSNIFGSIPMLASSFGSIPARALGSSILDNIDGSIPAA